MEAAEPEVAPEPAPDAAPEPEAAARPHSTLPELPSTQSVEQKAAELRSLIGDDGAADGATQPTISTLSNVAKLEEEFHQHELEQANSSRRLLLDLMRCISENHAYIAQQQQQLAANTKEIEALRGLLGEEERQAQLTDIQDELAKLRAQVEGTPENLASELADYRHKFKLLEVLLSIHLLLCCNSPLIVSCCDQEGQAKHTEDLTKAWGYIMADEAAEDVVNTAFDGQEGGEVDEEDEEARYARITAQALAIAGSQTTSKLRQALGDEGITLENAFGRWVALTIDEKEERLERERVEAEEAKAAEEQAAAAAFEAASAEEKKLLGQKEEEAKELERAKAEDPEWAAVREAEDALAKAEAQLLLATTPEEKAAALAAIEAAKERIETETRKAESQIALRKAEEMLANATTDEERQAALAMLDAAKAEVASAEAAVEAVRTKQKNGETSTQQPRIYLPPPSRHLCPRHIIAMFKICGPSELS